MSMITTPFAHVSEASKMLLENGFSPKNVSMALEKIGKGIHVDRVYVFENHDDPRTHEIMTSQRYEWSSVKAEPQINNPELQDIPFSEVAPEWVSTLSRGGTIAGLVRDMTGKAREILDVQDIKSILVCPIVAVGTNEWWGFVGFDDCRNLRPWPSEEIAVLKALARALAGALHHKDMKKKFSSVHSQLQEVIRRCAALTG